MFERFTDRARQTVGKAQLISGEMGHDYIGTEHLLLAILYDPESEATRVLNKLNVDLYGVRASLEKHFEGVSTRANPPLHTPFTPRAKKAMEMALRETLRRASTNIYIGPEHILLGILRDPDNEASVALKSLGVDYDAALYEYIHPPRSVETGDGRVRVTQHGSVVTVVIKAEASVTLNGHAFDGESYVLNSTDEHTITITLAD